MSYLNPLRLHFAGRFQAAPSTVNNDITHFDNATFKKEFQKEPWNSGGDAVWRLIGCHITAASHASGTPVDSADPILQYLIADSDRQVAAKLVDLDPQQQLVSAIWGLEVRICTPEGETLLRGQFDTASFTDIWLRSPNSAQGDIGAGAMYQSVLSHLEWGNLQTSPLLQELQATATDGLLSIKFNVDGYNLNFRSPEFTRGRIVGTIGPTHAGEPHHFVAGRQLMAVGTGPNGFFDPQGKINFCTAAVNAVTGKVLLDVGNAIPMSQPGGPPMELGTLTLAYALPPDANGNVTWQPLGDIAYNTPDWYKNTAGVAVLPIGRSLTPEEQSAIASSPLTLLLPDANGTPTPAVSEWTSGTHVRADQFVYRLSPGETAHARLFVTRFGQPYAHARILAFFDPNQLQQAPGEPDIATPLDALDFPARVVTDAQGMATLPIHAHDPQNPRGYIDGQVYGIRSLLEEDLSPEANYPYNHWDFISILAWDSFKPDVPLTWHGSMQPIFQQYANLYPIMSRFLDLGNYNEVYANRDLLLLVFDLDANDPNVMPVTRDLSPAKRHAIVRWLREISADKKPFIGEPLAALNAAESVAVAATSAPLPTEGASVDPSRVGKAAAMNRRLAVRYAKPRA